MDHLGQVQENRHVSVVLSVKRVLYMPPAAILAVGAGLTMASAVAKGTQDQAAAEAEASYLRTQGEQEKLGLMRDLDAADQEASRTLARSRAVLAATGGDTTSPGALDTLGYQEAQFAKNRQSLINDSDARLRGLNTRADSAESAGKMAYYSALLGGAGKSLSLFSGSIGGGASTAAAPAGGFSSVGSLITARGIR